MRLFDINSSEYMLLACHYLMLPLVYTNTNLTRVASGKRGVLKIRILPLHNRVSAQGAQEVLHAQSRSKAGTEAP